MNKLRLKDSKGHRMGFFEDEIKNDGSHELVTVDEQKMKMNVVATIKEIDMLYKQGILDYSENIQRYNIEIEKLKADIVLEHQKNMDEEKELLKLESIIEHESKIFESYQHKFTQTLTSLTELRDSYKKSLPEDIYNEKFNTKYHELMNLLREIEEKELSLLNQELERINLSKNFTKKLRKVEELERSLKALELEKSYFESTELQKLSYFHPKDLALKKENSPVVDTELID